MGADKRLGDRNDDRVRESQGDGGNDLDTRSESDNQLGVEGIQNVGYEGVSGSDYLNGDHTARKLGDIQHVQKSDFGRANPCAGADNLRVRGDFDCTRSLEEGCLVGVHSSVSCRNSVISRSKSTGSGRGGDLVLDDEVPNLLQIAGAKTNPMLPLACGTRTRLSNSGYSLRIKDDVRRTMAFLPMETVPLPQRAMQIWCIRLDPTLQNRP